MKNIILILSVFLLGCGTTISVDKKVNIEEENNGSIDESKAKITDTISNDLNRIETDNIQALYSNRNNFKLLNASNNQNYNVQDSLSAILNTDDPRKVVYLIHPNKPLLVYCYHDVKSECYIEGINNNKFFKYDISQVEGQNKGKLTSPSNPIDSAKTTPMKWMKIEDDYVMVLMTSKIILNSQQHTLNEPLVINYEKGMMVR